ncbi:MAG: DUF6504 family protein [Microbacteriaceae bacterium]
MNGETAQLEDIATVWTTPNGAPARFIWHGRRYLVHARPVPWVDRVRWWLPDERHVDGPVEQRMWQVQAREVDSGELLIFDLAVRDTPQWPARPISD